ncbi:MAG TPA: DUF3822 family protein [Hanamia sp.]|jgi:hypothetical protein|nr:DUF3822 family protein [Hanamia sp.]
MRPVFEILPSGYEPENCVLICEVNNEGFSYCVRDENSKTFPGVAVYHFDPKKPSAGFPIALQVLFHQQEIFSRKFQKVCVVYSFPESVLIPFSMYNRERNQTMMNMMFGDVNSADMILTDVITGQSMYNCYRIHTATLEMVKTQFPNASISHQYSNLFKKKVGEIDRLNVIFYSQKIVVDVQKEGKHLLLNSFEYSAAQDAPYILLNICRQFGLQKMPLHISGLIEENSSLYKELYKYFDEIEFAKLREDYSYADAITNFSSHYFSYIFDIDPCE